MRFYLVKIKDVNCSHTEQCQVFDDFVADRARADYAYRFGSYIVLGKPIDKSVALVNGSSSLIHLFLDAFIGGVDKFCVLIGETSHKGIILVWVMCF